MSGKFYSASDARYTVCTFPDCLIDSIDDLHAKVVEYNKEHKKILGYYYDKLVIFNENTDCKEIMLQFIKDRKKSKDQSATWPFIITDYDYHDLTDALQKIIDHSFLELKTNDIYEYTHDDGNKSYVLYINNYHSAVC
jgi:hypothetical protein